MFGLSEKRWHSNDFGFIFRLLEIMFIPWPCVTLMVMGRKRYVREEILHLCILLSCVHTFSHDGDISVERAVSFSQLILVLCCLSDELTGLICLSPLFSTIIYLCLSSTEIKTMMFQRHLTGREGRTFDGIAVTFTVL